MRPFPLIAGGVVAVVVLAGGGYAILSYMGQRAAETKVETVAEGIRSAGLEVTHGAIEVSGESATIQDVVITSSNAALPWRWTIPQALLTNIDAPRLSVDLGGNQTLVYGAADAAKTLEFTARDLHLDIDRTDAGRASAVTISANALAVRPPDATAPATAKEARLSLQMAAGDGAIPAGSTLALDLRDLALPSDQRGPLGSAVPAISVKAEVKQAVPGIEPGTAIPAWQAAGGQLAISEFRVQWGLLSMRGSGALGLDPAYRPSGELDGTIPNLLATLDAFDAARPFDEAAKADFYSAVLLAGGGQPEADAAIHFADGLMTITSTLAGSAQLTLGTVSPLLPLAPATQ